MHDLCPSNEFEKGRGEDKEGFMVVIPEKEKLVAMLDPFKSWMLVEIKSRRNQSSNGNLNVKSQGKNGEGSRFTALSSALAKIFENGDLVVDISGVNFQQADFLKNKEWASNKDKSKFSWVDSSKAYTSKNYGPSHS